MENNVCCSCQTPKATLQCGICESSLCKKCAQFLDEDSFSFQEKVPKELTAGIYCGNCFDEKVAPELNAYNEMMEKARNVFVFFKSQGKETRLVKRKVDPIKLTKIIDRDELILRMAFLAVKADFNALVDVEIDSEKSRSGSYKTISWHGTGVPALVDPRRQKYSS